MSHLAASRPPRALAAALLIALLLALALTGAPPVVAHSTIHVEAEDYRAGGEGVGYHDLTPGNAGNSSYRGDDVDMSTCGETCSGHYIHQFVRDEWLEYDIRVPTSETYELVIRYWTSTPGKQIRLTIDGADLGLQDVPITAPETWADLAYGEVELDAGDYRLRVIAVSDLVKLDYIELRPHLPGPVPPQPPAPPSPGESPRLPPPNHRVNTGPLFQLACDLGPRLFDDPIVHPGRPGASHEHQFFGATNAHADASYQGLVAGESTCSDRSDTAGYWIPTLYDDQGTLRSPKRVRVYYYTNAAEPGALTTFPPDLRIIAGDAGARGPQPDGVIHWLCRNRQSQSAGLALRSADPPRCARDQFLSLSVRFPDCWDGRHLDSSDHKRHMAYSDAARRCPPSHPVKVPKLRLSVVYESGPFIGGNFTLGGPRGDRRALPWYAMHADFWNTWDQAALETYVEGCLRQGRTVRKTGCQP